MFKDPLGSSLLWSIYFSTFLLSVAPSAVMGSPSKVLLVGGGGIGVIAALSLEANAQVDVTIALRSNYNTVVGKGYDITSCDHGELRGWRPAQGLFLGTASSTLSCS